MPKFEIHVVYIPFEGVEVPPVGYPVKYPYRTYDLAVTGFAQSFLRIPLFVRMAREIRRVIRIQRIDLVNAHWAIPSGFLSCLVASETPVITTLRGSDMNKFGRQPVYRFPIGYAMRHSAAVVALSKQLQQRAEDLGAASTKVHLIPNGVDTDLFRPMDKQLAKKQLGLSEMPTILFVGDLIKLKRVHKVIEASASLAGELPHQVIVLGDGPERGNLEGLTRELKCSNIVFAGRVPHQMMPMHMAASDVLVLPSESEGLPRCIQEAMACGIPVIGTKVGGIPDLVQHGTTGYLVDDVSQLAEAIRSLMLDTGRRVVMGAKALAFAHAELGIDSVTARTEELYAELLQRQN